MSFSALVVKVMIASPGDVSQERRLIREVIHEWNSIHSEDRGVVLLPVGWETDSTPEMGDRPQAIINRQLVKACDLLVAVFWTRLGSPSGGAASGTVEEINEHLASGKEAMIYFSSAPVVLDSVDSEQYARLKTFKEDLRVRGLFDEYEDLAEFRSKFGRHLAQKVIANFSSGSRAGDLEGLPTGAHASSVSDAASELLREAVKDKQGVVLRIGTIGGTRVQTNGRQFAEGRDARSEARWRGAVDELEGLGLIEDRAGKGEVFFVTNAGYEAGDGLA